MIDHGRIAAMGFSFGGLANIIVQNRNAKINAVLSLDGTERYRYALLRESPFFDPDNIDVPYLHMAQKKIPAQVLKEDNIPEELNTKFRLYDSIENATAYKLRFNHLTHSHFSTLGVLFEQRDKRQDKSDTEIMESYHWMSMHALHFFDAYLKNDSLGLRFWSIMLLWTA